LAMLVYCNDSYRGYRRAAVSLLVLILLSAGCATKQDVLQIEEKVSQIRNDQLLLRNKLDHLDSLATTGGEQDNQMRADVRNSVGELNSRLDNIQSQLEDLLQVAYRSSQRSSNNRVEQPMVTPTPGDTARAADSGKAPASSSVDCRSLWDEAFKNMRRGQYDLAIAGFNDYLKFCPQGDLKDNSQYWIAESYYEMRKFEQAIDEYNILLEAYPETEKRSLAYFKLGRSYEELGNKDKALEYFLRLQKDYPNSFEYQQVKDKIDEWQKKKKK
jgi:tol-pal system protein YbgF